MKNYTYKQIADISNVIDDAIRAVILMRRMDEDGDIFTNVSSIVRNANQSAQHAVDVFEKFWNEFAQYYVEGSNFLKKMTNNYNFLLDICQPNVYINERTRDFFYSKRKAKENDVHINDFLGDYLF